TAAQSQGPPPTTAKVKPNPAPPAPPGPAPEEKAAEEASWTVTAVGLSEEDARTVALQKARNNVLLYLAQQKPPIAFQPSLEYLQNAKFVKEETLKPDKRADEVGHDVVTQYECTLKVEVSPRLFRDILEVEHQNI